MSELADRPLRISSESLLLHWLRLFIWFSNLRLVPRWYEHRANLSRRLIRSLYWDGLTRVGKVVFICAVLIFLASYRVGSDYQLFTASLGFALLLWSAFLAVIYRPQVTVQRDTPAHVTAGDTVFSRATLTNIGPRTLRNFAVREMIVPDGRWPREWLWPHQLVLSPGSQCTVTVECEPRYRGVFELGGFTVHSYFPFFLTRTSQRLAVPAEISVLPATLPVTIPSLRKLADQASKQLTASGDHARKGPALDYSHSREYQVGDSLRRLDHRAGSRLGTAMSKVFEGVDEIRRDQVYLMIDSSLANFKRWQRRPEDDTALDERLALAVEIGLSAQNEGFSLVAVSLGPEWQELDSLQSFYRAIAAAPPRKTPQQSLEVNSSLLPENVLVDTGVYVLVLGRWSDEAQEKVQRWRHQGVLVLVFLIAESAAEADTLPAGDQYIEITTHHQRKALPAYLRLRQAVLNRLEKNLEALISRITASKQEGKR